MKEIISFYEVEKKYTSLNNHPIGESSCPFLKPADVLLPSLQQNLRRNSNQCHFYTNTLKCKVREVVLSHGQDVTVYQSGVLPTLHNSRFGTCYKDEWH